jgi:hypothetical protein
VDAFESIIALLLRSGSKDDPERYWTITGFKVNLTSEEKRLIGRSTTPRWEIDVVAYNAKRNEVLAIECKSFLNSRGVMFCEGGFKAPKRFKLFADKKARIVVLKALKAQLVEAGLCREEPSMRLCLAVGKIGAKCDRKGLAEFLEHQCQGKLFDSDWIDRRIAALATSQYENEVAHVAVKLYQRAIDGEKSQRKSR